MNSVRVLVLILSLTLSVWTHSRPTITFSCGIPENLPHWQIFLDLYTDVFNRLGYDFAMHYMNTKRESAEHKSGERYDGTCVRSKDFIDVLAVKHIVLVDTPVSKSVVSAWRNHTQDDAAAEEQVNLSQNLATDSKELFVDGSRVGYLRGTKMQYFLKGYYPKVSLVSFLKPDLGMKTLAAGRIDYWVGFSLTGDYLINKYQLESNVSRVGDVRVEVLYPFLHARHQGLAEPLKQELERYFDQRGGLID